MQGWCLPTLPLPLHPANPSPHGSALASWARFSKRERPPVNLEACLAEFLRNRVKGSDCSGALQSLWLECIIFSSDQSNLKKKNQSFNERTHKEASNGLGLNNNLKKVSGKQSLSPGLCSLLRWLKEADQKEFTLWPLPFDYNYWHWQFSVPWTLPGTYLPSSVL